MNKMIQLHLASPRVLADESAVILEDLKYPKRTFRLFGSNVAFRTGQKQVFSPLNPSLVGYTCEHLLALIVNAIE